MLSCMYQCKIRRYTPCGIILDNDLPCKMLKHWILEHDMLVQANCSRLAFKRGTCAAVKFKRLPAGSPGLLLLLKKDLEP